MSGRPAVECRLAARARLAALSTGAGDRRAVEGETELRARGASAPVDEARSRDFARSFFFFFFAPLHDASDIDVRLVVLVMSCDVLRLAPSALRARRGRIWWGEAGKVEAVASRRAKSSKSRTHGRWKEGERAWTIPRVMAGQWTCAAARSERAATRTLSSLSWREGGRISWRKLCWVEGVAPKVVARRSGDCRMKFQKGEKKREMNLLGEDADEGNDFLSNVGISSIETSGEEVENGGHGDGFDEKLSKSTKRQKVESKRSTSSVSEAGRLMAFLVLEKRARSGSMKVLQSRGSSLRDMARMHSQASLVMTERRPVSWAATGLTRGRRVCAVVKGRGTILVKTVLSALSRCFQVS